MGEQQTKIWPEVVLVLVFTGTALAVLILTVSGSFAGLGSATDAARAQQRRLLTAAFLLGTVVPLVCAIIAYRLELVALLAMNVVLLLLTAAFYAVVVLNSARHTSRPEYPPATGCQVYSGSDNTCPGG